MRHSKRFTGWDVALYVLMALVVFITAYPFWHEIVVSFDGSAATARSSGFKLWPGKFTPVAYSIILQYGTMWRGFGNSLLRVVLSLVCTLFMTMLTAYPLSKKDVPFHKAYTTFLFITMLIGGGLIPNYLLIMKYLHLGNTIWALVLPGILSAYDVFIVRNFYKSIPGSIEESAMLDGAGWFTIWLRLVIPLSTPVIAVIALWTAVGNWNAWFDAMLYISDGNLVTLPIVLRKILIDTSATTDFQKFQNLARGDTELQGKSVEAALLIVSITPMLILYPFLQKYFVQGINVGSIKE